MLPFSAWDASLSSVTSIKIAGYVAQHPEVCWAMFDSNVAFVATKHHVHAPVVTMASNRETCAPPTGSLVAVARLGFHRTRREDFSRCYLTGWEFAGAILAFPRKPVPENRAELCNPVTNNFHIISPEIFCDGVNWVYPKI